ncbi:unnamed protein product [Didymodactylos carnosus]|uniref:Transglutaminase-like domain-containing protein n=1 Tax=Didymodactylos carnosus TaxID=1234261 RepID=A0A8S2DVZ0_9BILA|nr:unnamed protein product [Didymodactylos carnosus]CAF3791541.1 unnamed protein product [Didymodactylos carnosus]
MRTQLQNILAACSTSYAIGQRSFVSKDTQIRIPVEGESAQWSVKKLDNSKSGKARIEIEINSPSDAIIGKYRLLLEIRNNQDEVSLFLFEEDIYILYNPWKKDDACGLKSETEIAEYVQNENGIIYGGSSTKTVPKQWYYGQFEAPSLITALTLLDKAYLPLQSRSDPALIVRILASKICSNPGDNNGIFTSEFGEQNDQQHWSSSTAVLKQYLEQNAKSVQNGKDWIYAAILCTLCRSLGIPCRVVTVYKAAYDADGNMSSDIHWNQRQQSLKQLNRDVTWPSHVWNECWMKRSDSKNKSCWQVVDSTPVRMCDGMRRCGPCPVDALKNADLSHRWDSPYLFSSINGTKIHWLVEPDGNMKAIDVEEGVIGEKILTKSLENEIPEDITNDYKSKDVEEQKNITKSCGLPGGHVKRENVIDEVKKKSQKYDVDIQLEMSTDVTIGDATSLIWRLKNNSKQTRTVSLSMTTLMTNISGHPLNVCKEIRNESIIIQADEEQRYAMRTEAEDYMKEYKPDNNLKIYLSANVAETDQTFAREEDVVFKAQDIIQPILKDDVVEAGKPFTLQIQFNNPTKRFLPNGKLHIDGLGICRTIVLGRPLRPLEKTIFSQQFIPTRIGHGLLYVKFSSTVLHDSSKFIPLEVIKVNNPPFAQINFNPGGNMRQTKADEDSNSKQIFTTENDAKTDLYNRGETEESQKPSSEKHEAINSDHIGLSTNTDKNILPNNQNTKVSHSIVPHTVTDDSSISTVTKNNDKVDKKDTRPSGSNETEPTVKDNLNKTESINTRSETVPKSKADNKESTKPHDVKLSEENQSKNVSNKHDDNSESLNIHNKPTTSTDNDDKTKNRVTAHQNDIAPIETGSKTETKPAEIKINELHSIVHDIRGGIVSHKKAPQTSVSQNPTDQIPLENQVPGDVETTTKASQNKNVSNKQDDNTESLTTNNKPTTSTDNDDKTKSRVTAHQNDIAPIETGSKTEMKPAEIKINELHSIVHDIRGGIVSHKKAPQTSVSQKPTDQIALKNQVSGDVKTTTKAFDDSLNVENLRPSQNQMTDDVESSKHEGNNKSSFSSPATNETASDKHKTTDAKAETSFVDVPTIRRKPEIRKSTGFATMLREEEQGEKDKISLDSLDFTIPDRINEYGSKT